MKSEQSTIHVFSINLSRWLGSGFPEWVVEAAREILRNGESKRIRGSWVAAFGDDLHVHLTTFNGDFKASEDPAALAVHVARKAALAALGRGFEAGLCVPATKANPMTLTGAELDRSARPAHASTTPTPSAEPSRSSWPRR